MRATEVRAVKRLINRQIDIYFENTGVRFSNNIFEQLNETTNKWHKTGLQNNQDGIVEQFIVADGVD